MWNGGKEAETENFPRGRGGGRLFRWRVYFSWLVLEFGVKVPRPIVITLTLVTPYPGKFVIGGKALKVSNPHKQSEKIHGFRYLIYLG